LELLDVMVILSRLRLPIGSLRSTEARPAHGGTYLATTEPSLIRQLNLASGTDRPKIRSAPTSLL